MIKQGMEQELISVREIMAKWLVKINARSDAAEMLKGGLLLNITGPNGGTWFFNGINCEFSCGEAKKTLCTVQMPSDVLQGIYKQCINPQEAFSDGRIQVIGDPKMALFLSSAVF